jgi:hypothetical protein
VYFPQFLDPAIICRTPGCFQGLAVVCSAAMRVGAQASLLCPVSPGYMPGAISLHQRAPAPLYPRPAQESLRSRPSPVWTGGGVDCRCRGGEQRGPHPHRVEVGAVMAAGENTSPSVHTALVQQHGGAGDGALSLWSCIRICLLVSGAGTEPRPQRQALSSTPPALLLAESARLGRSQGSKASVCHCVLIPPAA